MFRYFERKETNATRKSVAVMMEGINAAAIAAKDVEPESWKIFSDEVSV
jgi:hypothetical protein